MHPKPPQRATIIFLNGASSAGKTTLALALQQSLQTPFYHFSSDQLVEARVLPPTTRRTEGGHFAWSALRPRFFDGFHRCIAALADAGNDLIVDHIIEHASWLDDCVLLLASHRVFYVGVHCELDELERRERLRGDRRLGEGREHLLEDRIHELSPYDFEVNTSRHSPEENAHRLMAALAHNNEDGVFERRLSRLRREGQRG